MVARLNAAALLCPAGTDFHQKTVDCVYMP